MNESLFIQYVNKWFGPIITKITETINGKAETEPQYMHVRMLKKEFSTTLKWGSISSNGRNVVADVVSMDTSLPLKMRSSLKKAEGDIPKLGMKMYLNERTMTDINILTAQGNREADVVRKLFADTRKCYYGVKEQLEYMFLMALSTGVTVIEDVNNSGVAIRIDFNHSDANKFGAANGAWSGASAKPISDIENVITEAEKNGHVLRYIKMDRKSFNSMRKHTEVRELFAAQLGINGSNFPSPTLSQLNDTLNDNYGVQIEIIERTVIAEKNGTQTTLKPWGDNKVVFLTSEDVGTITYGQLAEETHPVEGVVYEKADDFILLSKFHKNDPLREYTSSQALVLPVIQNIDEVYILDCEEADADAQTEDDADFSYDGTDYTKASVVLAINTANPDAGANASQTDAYLQILINALSDEQIVVFEDTIVASV